MFQLDRQYVTFVGNFHSTWASSGGYALIAKELLRGEEAVNATSCEFDTERVGAETTLQK